MRRVIDYRAPEHHAAGMQIELEGGGDTEVAAAAAQTPEQIGMLLPGGA